MICPRCKNNEVNVHFKGVINNKSVKLDLCQSCAQKVGLGFPSFDFKLSGLLESNPFLTSTHPIIKDLFSVLSNWPKLSTTEYLSSKCDHCQWSLAKFQKTGNMGCPECYRHFRGDIKRIVKKIHGASTYEGIKPKSGKQNPPPLPKVQESLSHLKKQLDKAVKDERFEEAAVLRDKIKNWNEPKK